MASKLKLTEDDILRATLVILPVSNAATAKTQEIFRGNPMTVEDSASTLNLVLISSFHLHFAELVMLLLFTRLLLCSCFSDLGNICVLICIASLEFNS